MAVVKESASVLALLGAPGCAELFVGPPTRVWKKKGDLRPPSVEIR